MRVESLGVLRKWGGGHWGGGGLKLGVGDPQKWGWGTPEMETDPLGSPKMGAGDPKNRDRSLGDPKMGRGVIGGP